MAALHSLLFLLGLALLAHASPLNKVSKRRNMIGGRPHFGLVPKPPKEEYTERTTVHVATFPNLVDHFDGNNTATYRQRYWYRDELYVPGGPVFFMLGGESAEDGYWLSDDTLEWTNLAKQHGAFLFLAEHRYYGDSNPTPDMSTKNLKYLSSAQAIEDYAAFIRGMIQKFPQLGNASWVTFGGSYSGNLAAWMRVKHPELVSYAVGSSGPVFAEVDFVEYMEVVQNSITQTSQSCADSIRQGMQQVAQLLTTSSGRATLKSTFSICENLDITNTKQIQNFWSTVFGPYMETVQYSGDNAGVFKNSITISHALCRYHNQNNTSLLTRLKNVNDYYNTMFGYTGCQSINYDDMIAWMQDTSFGEAADTRAWVWQTCTEFGYYQSTDSATAGPFWGGLGRVNVTFYIQQCMDIYGADYNSDEIAAAVAVTNKFYGGRSLNGATYIILPNGDFDPWHALGKLNSSDPTIVPVVIHGTAHCADMYSSSGTDLPALIAARQLISDTLGAWLGSSSSSKH